MAILSSTSLPASSIKVRWLEPYVSAALNQKSVGLQPKGVFTGFNVVPFGAFGISVQIDPTLGISGANVLETTGGKYSVSLIQDTNVAIDLAPFFSQIVFIALDVQYATNVTSTAQILVVNAAELGTNPDLVLLAKVNVPGVGPVLTTHINMGYRLLAGDSITPESRPTINLLPNGSFERDPTGAFVPAGWVSSSGSLVLSVDGTISHSGSKSMKLVGSPAGSYTATSDAVIASPGSKYRVGGWIRSDGGDPITGGAGVRIQVDWYDSTDVLISTSNVDDNPSAPLGFTGGGTTFVQRVAELTAPANTFTAKYKIFYDGCAGTLYLDDAQFLARSSDILPTSVFGGVGAVADAYHTHSTFPQLTTHNVGVAVGTSGKWEVRGPMGNDFHIYNDDFFTGTGEIAYQFRLDGAGDGVHLIFNDSFARGFIGLSQGGAVFNSYNGMGIGTGDSTPLSLVTNDTLRWQVLNTGELQAQGADRAIQSVLNPVNQQDAATKNYVDAITRKNALINGGLRWWERGSIHPFTGVTVPGYNVLGYTADRWYGQVNDNFGGGNTIDVEYRRITVPAPPSTSGLLSTNRVMQIRNLDAGSQMELQFVQEVDRETVVRLRGKKVSWRVAIRKGISAPGGASWKLNLWTGVGLSNIKMNAYSPGYIAGASNGSVNSLSSTAFTYFTGTSLLVIDELATTAAVLLSYDQDSTGPGDPDDYLQFGEVQLVEGDVPPTDFTWAADDATAELYLCQRYYEKSGRPDFTVPIGGSFGREISVCLGFPGIGPGPAAGDPWPLAHPRLRVTKRSAPTVRIWTIAGPTANEWELPGGDGVTGGDPQLTAVGLATHNGFELLNNTGGYYISIGSGNAIGQWDADAEI